MERLERFDRLAVIGVHLSERSEGRVRAGRGGLRIGYRLEQRDADVLRLGIARAADIHFAVGVREVYPQIGRLPALRPGDQRTLLENAPMRPAELRLEAFHPMGTARMGPDAGSSVVAPSGESHDVPGLHVVDASLFPTAGGDQPHGHRHGVRAPRGGRAGRAARLVGRSPPTRSTPRRTSMSPGRPCRCSSRSLPW